MGAIRSNNKRLIQQRTCYYHPRERDAKYDNVGESEHALIQAYDISEMSLQLFALIN